MVQRAEDPSSHRKDRLPHDRSPKAPSSKEDLQNGCTICDLYPTSRVSLLLEVLLAIERAHIHVSIDERVKLGDNKRLQRKLSLLLFRRFVVAESPAQQTRHQL